jgi:hypothetical protein
MSSSLTSPMSANVVSLGLPDIALAGKSGAGKSTAAQLLEQLGYQTRSFAAPLKRIAAELWGEAATTDRAKLQCLGVAVREIDPDTWAKLLIRDTRPISQSMGYVGPRGYPVVVDDLRFENEWFALKGEGFVIVRVEAPRLVRIDRLKGNGKWQDADQLEHVSETAVSHLTADHTIPNDGTTNAFYDELVDVVIKERRRR